MFDRMNGGGLNLNRSTIHDISIEEMGMRKICAKLVPKTTKTEGMYSWTSLNTSKMTKNFFRHVITGDETRIFEYDPVQQSSEWHKSNSPRLKKPRMTKSKIKFILICFFDSQGVVHKEFVPQLQTVNKEYYRDVFERLRKRVHCVRPEIVDTWILHRDNAPSHNVISVKEFLKKKRYSSGSAAHILA